MSGTDGGRPFQPPRLRIVAAPADPLEHWLASVRGALSTNTERAIRTDLGIYRLWCERRHLEPWPAHAVSLARFIDAMGREKAPATVRRYVASVSALCRALGWNNPLKSTVVQTALRRMHRKKGRRQTQAHGLTWAIRQTLMNCAGDRVIDDRNRALLAVAYDALLRRSELVALQVTDLKPERDGAATLLVRRSKTDQEGCAAALYLAPDTVGMICRWLERSGISDGFLFRSVGMNDQPGGQLHSGQVSRIYKSMARKAGLAEELVADLSGHSTRVGATQDMIASGIELPAILQAGRWKSTAMVNRYGERLMARRGGSAQLAELQNRSRRRRR